jgi:hypothetical protein
VSSKLSLKPTLSFKKTAFALLVEEEEEEEEAEEEEDQEEEEEDVTEEQEEEEGGTRFLRRKTRRRRVEEDRYVLHPPWQLVARTGRVRWKGVVVREKGLSLDPRRRLESVTSTWGGVERWGRGERARRSRLDVLVGLLQPTAIKRPQFIQRGPG